MKGDIMKEHQNVGIGFIDVLQIVFITLKLCGVIDWPWMWVLSPIWISACLIAVVAAVIIFKKL